MPVAIIISILSKLRLLPIILFGGIFWKYNTIITKKLMKNLLPILEKREK